MEILVTGGYGYLGARIVRHLGDSMSVHAASRQPRNTSQTVVDFSSPDSLQKACHGKSVVIHTAGINASESAADPVAAYEVNAVATGRLIEAAIKENVRRFIYFSTAHVYRSPLQGVIDENEPAVNLHPYAASHRAGEEILRYVTSLGKIDGVVLRLSNAFGSPAIENSTCWHLLINDLCRQAVTSQELVLYSSGLQRRNFIPIETVCRATAFFVNRSSSAPSDNVYNLGSSWNPTLREVAELVQQRYLARTGTKLPIRTASARQGESSADLDYSSRKLELAGFQNDYDIHGELDSLFRYCESHFMKNGN